VAADYSSYKVASGETSSSSKFDNFVQAVQDFANAVGDTTKMTFASGLIFDPAKIIQSAATSGQVLAWDGTKWAPSSAPGTSYRKLTEKDVVNTVTETDLLNNEITVGANAMSTNKILRCILAGDYLNNSGAARALALKIKLGATTAWSGSITSGGGNIAASASRRAWRLAFEIANLGATNSQFMTGEFHLGAATAPATGVSDAPSSSVAAASVDASAETTFPLATNGTLTVDTTSSQILAVNCTHPTANASLSMRLKYAVVEVV
jgi:hypothetical protein